MSGTGYCGQDARAAIRIILQNLQVYTSLFFIADCLESKSSCKQAFHLVVVVVVEMGVLLCSPGWPQIHSPILAYWDYNCMSPHPEEQGVLNEGPSLCSLFGDAVHIGIFGLLHINSNYPVVKAVQEGIEQGCLDAQRSQLP